MGAHLLSWRRPQLDANRMGWWTPLSSLWLLNLPLFRCWGVRGQSPARKRSDCSQRGMEEGSGLGLDLGTCPSRLTLQGWAWAVRSGALTAAAGRWYSLSGSRVSSWWMDRLLQPSSSIWQGKQMCLCPYHPAWWQLKPLKRGLKY